MRQQATGRTAHGAAPWSGGRRGRRGGFVNVRALEWAARQNISHAVARVLLIELALLAGDDFSCVISLQALASRTSRDRNTVRKWVHLLVSSGLVDCEDRFADDGTRLASRYVLNHPDAGEVTSSPAGQPFSPPLPGRPEGDSADSVRGISPSRKHRESKADSPTARTGKGTRHYLPRPRPTMPGDDPVLPLDLGDTPPGRTTTGIRSGTG